jgi:spore germination protein KA
MIALLINFTSKRSFGVPYMAPIMPMVKDELDDAVIRSPMPDMKTRPKIMTWARSIRRHKNNKN